MQKKRLLGFLLSTKQVSAYGTTSWVEIRETPSPVGTIGSPRRRSQNSSISKYSAIENSRSAARIQDHVSIAGSAVPTGLFSNGVALATALGGSLDLNRSPRFSVRLSPDYLLTRFGGVSQNEFAISVGVLYRFSKMRKH